MAKNVGLVLNFEARGSGGPSYMLVETNQGNAKLIKAFNEASPPFPVANSMMYSIYKMLPNDTDLTVFREEGHINGSILLLLMIISITIPKWTPLIEWILTR